MSKFISREAKLGHAMSVEISPREKDPPTIVYPFQRIPEKDIEDLRHKLGLVATRIFMRKDVPNIKDENAVIDNPRFDFQASTPENPQYTPVESNDRERALQREEVIGRTRAAIVESVHFTSEEDRMQAVIDLIKCCDRALLQYNAEKKLRPRVQNTAEIFFDTSTMDPVQFQRGVRQSRIERQQSRARHRQKHPTAVTRKK